MSASETVMHQIFSEIVERYHPFADYVGYQEGEDGFLIHYQGPNGRQAMIVDTQGNVINDSSVGTTRTMGLLVGGLAVLSMLFGGQPSR